jgi:GH18 family chitinase
MFTAYESYKSILARDANAHTKSMLNVDDGIYYDGHAVVQQKAQYVLDQDFGGLMIWSLESDSRDQSKSLLKVANTALGN